MLSDEQIEDLIANATAPLLTEIEQLKIKVKILEDIVTDVPDDVVRP